MRGGQQVRFDKGSVNQKCVTYREMHDALLTSRPISLTWLGRSRTRSTSSHTHPHTKYVDTSRKPDTSTRGYRNAPNTLIRR